MNKGRLLALVAVAGIMVSAASPPNEVPRRKAGWWQITTHLPGGRSVVRNLCLDATSDIRHNVLKPADGCTMAAQKLANGYKFKKSCGSEVTTGSAVGDFNSAYAVTKSRGSMTIHTDARWIGACPAGRRADQLWMQDGLTAPPK